MKRLPTAPSGAKKAARLPSPDRAIPSSSHPDEGLARQVAGAPVPEPTRAAAPPEPPGSTPSSLLHPPPSWRSALRAHVDDAIAAGLDATAPPGERDLGRRMARLHIVEARRAIDALFATAEGAP